MLNFKMWLEGSEIVFQTAQGSIYKFDGKKTVRFKTPHQGHLPTDVGVKQASELTIFVDPQFAREVGMWQTSSAQKKRLILWEGKVVLLSLNPKTQQHGKDRIIGNPGYVLTPAVGLSPLELWDRDTHQWSWSSPGLEVFSGSHPGNAIVKINLPQNL